MRRPRRAHLLPPHPQPAVDASVNAPGGLSPRRTPQLVLFTHDDAITSKTYDSMMAVMEGVAANGCPMSATFFTTSSGTGGRRLAANPQLGARAQGAAAARACAGCLLGSLFPLQW